MKQVRKRKNTQFDAATHCMSSTSRPPSPHLRSRVDDLRIMTWRWLSFTHIWISLGAFATTLVSGVWCSHDLALQGTGILMATWVALSTGLGYSVQRAIKHAKHPQNMPSGRERFWTAHGRKCWSDGAFCGSHSTCVSSTNSSGIVRNVKRWWPSLRWRPWPIRWFLASPVA